MLAALFDPILPILAVLVAGYLLARRGLVQVTDAQSMNRYTFFLATPALVVSVIGAARPADIPWTPALVYLGAEAVVYALVFCLMRFGFKRDLGEAILLGMTAIFANHVFYVLPIAERFYPEAGRAMAGMLLLDITVIFCGTVLLTEIATGSGGIRGALARLARNPFVYAPPIGLALGALGAGAPAGIWTFLEFTAATAAPVALFTLGVTLAAAPVFPVRLPCWTVLSAKLALVPVLVWAGFHWVGVPEGSLDHTILILVAAGPCGAMPFVIATQYGVRTGTIAKTIFISTLLSVFSLAILLP